MGFLGFGKRTGGAFADMIRCDESEYLIWKWRPEDSDADQKGRENAIRWGSSLRVKEGEVAVFAYKQKGGSYDFIEGPFDDTIKTMNFPIISDILGALYDGGTPFQAEVFYINLAGNIKINFGVRYFDVFDPRSANFAVPVSANGTLIINIKDYRGFVRRHRLTEFDIDAFKSEVQKAIEKYIKGIVSNIPMDSNIPVLQLDRKTIEINDIVLKHLSPIFEDDFGVNLKRMDFSLNVDKESEGYKKLMKVTAEQEEKIIEASTSANVKNIKDMQEINAKNLAESMRIQWEEAQRAQKLQTESSFLGAHAINQQASVAKEAASHIGEIGSNGGLGGGSDAMNPAGMMTGMMVGAAMGRGVAGMMNQTFNPMQNQTPPSAPFNAPPPPPNAFDENKQVHISQNGQQFGPYTIKDVKAFIAGGNITDKAFVWAEGLAEWTSIKSFPPLANCFSANMTPPPPPPPIA